MHVITIRAKSRTKLTQDGARQHTTRVLVVRLMTVGDTTGQSFGRERKREELTLACGIFPGRCSGICSPRLCRAVHMAMKGFNKLPTTERA
jgi:hypothetical protein